jgi:hypothetical protein
MKAYAGLAEGQSYFLSEAGREGWFRVTAYQGNEALIAFEGADEGVAFRATQMPQFIFVRIILDDTYRVSWWGVTGAASDYLRWRKAEAIRPPGSTLRGPYLSYTNFGSGCPLTQAMVVISKRGDRPRRRHLQFRSGGGSHGFPYRSAGDV